MSKPITRAFQIALVAGAGLMAVASVQAATPDAVTLKSASAPAFAPNGVLLVGDSVGGALVSIDTGDKARAGAGSVQIDGLMDKIAATLGTTADQVKLQDIAVNPTSGAVFIAVHRGAGADMVPVLLRADRAGKLEVFATAGHKMTSVALSDAPTKATDRSNTITDIAFSNGKVLVAGLSNEEFSSAMRTFSYPLATGAKAASVQMYHDSHSRFETAAPVRTFLTYNVNGQPTILAAYTCTPLVKIPVSEVADGASIKATTITELGNQNRPIDMIAYQKDGKPYILLANSARGVMKIDVSNINAMPAITTPNVAPTGMAYQTLADLKDVTQLDKVDDKSAVIVIASAAGSSLKTIGLP